jgi:hypothetical protein
MSDSASGLTPREAGQIAEAAYVYGYPLVLMEVTRRVLTHAATPDPVTRKAPLGQFVHTPKVPRPTLKSLAPVEVDALYSSAWLDLSAEPVILHLPNTHGRYYVMELLDAWTDVFAMLGTTTTGTRARNIAIVGPGWSGTLPPRVQRIASPTNLVWIIGRTVVHGAADVENVQAIQQRYQLTPLHTWGKPSTTPVVPVDPTVDADTSPVEQVDRMDAVAFFDTLAALLPANPPAPADQPMLTHLARIGIVPGHPFDMAALDAATQQALQQALPRFP